MSSNTPQRALIILGQAPLMGALTGYLALELGPDHTVAGSRLWTLYEQDAEEMHLNDASASMKRPYGRICCDVPNDAGDDLTTELMFWINPNDRLAQAAGLGSEWLIPTEALGSNGLIHAQINTLMLAAQVISQLGLEPSALPAPLAP